MWLSANAIDLIITTRKKKGKKGKGNEKNN